MKKIIAIALVFKDIFDHNGKFEERWLMIKRISAASGGYGLPGIEVTPEVEEMGIEVSLKIAIEKEMTGLTVVNAPVQVCQLDHEGESILVYKVNFVGRPEQDHSNPGGSAIYKDWSPYKLTDLAKRIIKKLPHKRNLIVKHHQVRAKAF
ncbi:MAG: hypothetical protein WCP93_03905 [Candidatus Berkelbacteria bacterium]